MNWIVAAVLMSLGMVAGEVLKKSVDVRPEYHRKFVHISSAICAAFLPLLLSLDQIGILGLAFTPALIAMHRQQTLKAMVSERTTYGSIFFPLGCAAPAFLAPNVSAYVASILVMGLADGIAGLFSASKRTRNIRTPGTIKPVTGRVVFCGIAAGVLFAVNAVVSLGVPPWGLLGIAVITSIAEAVSPYGSDNVTTSAIPALLLRLF